MAPIRWSRGHSAGAFALLVAITLPACGMSHAPGGSHDAGPGFDARRDLDSGAGFDAGRRFDSSARLDSGSFDTGPIGDAGACDARLSHFCGGGGEAPWPGLALCTFDPLPAFADLDFADLRPRVATDYYEIRRARRFFSPSDRLLASVGTACATATNPARCRADLAALRMTAGFGPGCPPEDCVDYLVVNQGDAVFAVTDAAGVTAWLAPVDTPTEAALLTWARGYRFGSSDRSRSGVRTSGSGYDLLVQQISSYCGPVTIDRVQVRVTSAGVAGEVRRQVWGTCPGACI